MALNGLPSILTGRPASAGQLSDEGMAAAQIGTNDLSRHESGNTSIAAMDVDKCNAFALEEEAHRRIHRIGEGFCSPGHQLPTVLESGQSLRQCTCAAAANFASVRPEGIWERENRLAAGFCAPQQASCLTLGQIEA